MFLCCQNTKWTTYEHRIHRVALILFPQEEIRIKYHEQNFAKN